MSATTEIRERLARRLVKAKDRLAKISDRINESRYGKLLAAAQANVEECEQLLALLPPAEPKPPPSSARASAQPIPEGTIETVSLATALGMPQNIESQQEVIVAAPASQAHQGPLKSAPAAPPQGGVQTAREPSRQIPEHVRDDDAGPIPEFLRRDDTKKGAVA